MLVEGIDDRGAFEMIEEPGAELVDLSDITEAELDIPDHHIYEDMPDSARKLAEKFQGVVVLGRGEWGAYYYDDDDGGPFVEFTNGVKVDLTPEKKRRPGAGLVFVVTAIGAAAVLLSQPGERPRYVDMPTTSTTDDLAHANADVSSASTSDTLPKETVIYLEPHERFPVFGDGVPDSSLTGPNGITSVDLTSEYVGYKAISVDCIRGGEDHIVVEGDTVSSVALEHFRGDLTGNDSAEAILYATAVANAVKAGAIEGEDDVLEIGESLPVVEHCVTTNHDIDDKGGTYRANQQSIGGVIYGEYEWFIDSETGKMRVIRLDQ